MNKILQDLNQEQKSAVLFNDNHQIILAGAGSGKTRTLTHKIAYLCDQKVPGHSIVAITFTNKAANEMKDRIATLIGQSSGVLACTFHSLCNRILRTYYTKVNLESNFTIYDEKDQIKVIEKILENYPDSKYTSYKLKNDISFSKNNMKTPDSMMHILEDSSSLEFITLYQEYNEILAQNNSIDFDDLLLLTLDILEDNDIRTVLQEKYKYIFVDEFQDTNKPQFEIIRKLVGKKTKLCVVGDDNQSIYGWRGSDIDYLLNFNIYYPDCKVSKLEINYRSRPRIIQAAQNIIDLNINKTDKKLIPNRSDDKKRITIFKEPNEYEEASRIISEIRTLNTKHKYEDIAILYRTNIQSRVLEDLARRNNIPYRIVGGLNFYARKEIKDIISFLKLINNTKDNIALNRVINFPPKGFGKKSMEKLVNLADFNNNTLFESCQEIHTNFYNNIITLKNNYKEHKTISILIKDIITTFKIREYWTDINENSDIDRNGNIMELINTLISLEETDSLELTNFLQDAALAASNKEDNKNCITLMTAHASKGLEYSVIFICGLMEGLFPLPVDTHKELEEERRLFYVALTRAKNKAYLTYSKRRYKYGQETYYYRSHFIEQIPSKYKELKR